MNRISLPKTLVHFGQIFENAGFSCYLVGGAVRNILSKLSPSDYDFTTNATPEEVKRIFKRVIPTGIEHGTVTVLFEGKQFEVTTFRIEEKYSDNRHPNKVHYTLDIEKDLSRRDFTINAIAASLKDGTIIDPIKGQHDIKKKIIRAIGTAENRFNEDGLRILRLFRFHAQLEFKIDLETLAAAKKCKKKLRKISVERIRVELTKILLSRAPSKTFRLLQESDILEIILPELSACCGVEQNQYHKWDVFEHSIHCVDAIPPDSIELRLAALLHDIGKPITRDVKEDGQATFYNHEQVSGKMTNEIMRRLKFSNSEIERTVHLVTQHMFNYTPNWSDKAIRKFIVRIGVKNLPDLYKLRLADRVAHKGEKCEDSDLKELAIRIEKVLKAGDALTLKNLKINGKDLLQLGIPAGKIIGIILKELLDAVMEDPTQNEKKQLIKIAKQIYHQRIAIK